MDFTNDDIASLGDKLAAMDLTDGEREALRTIVALAAEPADDEVAGFAETVHLYGKLADLGSLGSKLGPPTGRFASDGGLGTTRIILMDESETI